MRSSLHSERLFRIPPIFQCHHIQHHNNQQPDHATASRVILLRYFPLFVGFFSGFVGLGAEYVQPDVHLLEDFEVFGVLGVCEAEVRFALLGLEGCALLHELESRVLV